MFHQNIHAYPQITHCHNPVGSSLYITCCSNIKDAFFKCMHGAIFIVFITVNKCTINIMQPQIHCLHKRL